MRAVWKVNLREALHDSAYIASGTIELPQGAVPRAVQYQRGDLCLWAEVDTESPTVERTVHIIGTGRAVPPQADYLGTVQDTSGLFVWHVYVSR